MTGFDVPPAHLRLSMPVERQNLVFLDFEASGLGPDSWPIEIGLARAHENGSVSIDTDLIQPHPNWSMKAWSAASAEVHGITRSALHFAPTAENIASGIIPLLVGKTLISDTPELDERWLCKLIRIVDRELVLPVYDFDELLARTFDRKGFNCAYRKLGSLPRLHRAGDNAARLAYAWLAGMTA